MSPDTPEDAAAVAPVPESAVVPPTKRRSRIGRALDIAAVLIVMVAVYHFVIAPRLFKQGASVAAPPVALAAMDGSRFDLRAHRGRVVFLDFWASWCGPCKLSLPMAEHFAADHPDVDVIAVNSGEPDGIARAYAASHDLKRVVFDPDQTATHAFGIDAYPTMMVIDANGRVQAKWVGLDPLLETHMANAASVLAGAKKKSG
jgi:thiol-disulfide isomerase/thioredoxin